MKNPKCSPRQLSVLPTGFYSTQGGKVNTKSEPILTVSEEYSPKNHHPPAFEIVWPLYLREVVKARFGAKFREVLVRNSVRENYGGFQGSRFPFFSREYPLCYCRVHWCSVVLDWRSCGHMLRELLPTRLAGFVSPYLGRLLYHCECCLSVVLHFYCTILPS
jgi:hypothetical protein